jgi:hypothetical protein
LIVRKTEAGYQFARMIKALFLIFETCPAWDRVVAAKRGLAFVLGIYLLPMMLITSVVEAWGLEHWGKWQPHIQEVRHFSRTEVVSYETVQFILLLSAMFISARFIQTVTKTFHGRQTLTQSFTAVAYGLSPMFLCKLLDISSSMNPLITWAIGITMSVWILYQGLPRVLMPDPTHALGLYMVTALMLFLATGLVRVMTAMYLQGRVDVTHSYLVRKIAHYLEMFQN